MISSDPSNGKTTSERNIFHQSTVNCTKTALEEKTDGLRKILSTEENDNRCVEFLRGHQIILLFGPSTSGKTSIMKELEKTIPGSLSIGLDQYIPEQASLFLQQKEPELYRIMAEVLTPIEITECVLGEASAEMFRKKDISESQWTVVKQSIEQLKQKKEEIEDEMENLDHKAMDYVIEKSKEHPLVVFDPLLRLDFVQHCASKNFSASLKIVCVYCPFSELAARVALRNIKALATTGNRNEWRPPLHPIMQFLDYYRPALAGELVVDVLQRADVEDTFEKAFNEHCLFYSSCVYNACNALDELNKLTDSNDSLLMEKKKIALSDLEVAQKEYEKAIKEYDKMKSDVLIGLGFSNPAADNIEITPKFLNVQHVFNTKVLRPAESARIIQSWQ
jgi:hypothetical protein